MTSTLTTALSTVIPTEDAWSLEWGCALTDDAQVFAELPRAAYDQLPGYNYSFLKVLWKYSPFKAWLDFRDPNRPTRERKDHFLHGDLHHCLLLEPEKYNHRYAIAPEDAPKRPTEAQLLRLAGFDVENLGIIPPGMPKRPTEKQLATSRPKNEASQAYKKWLDIVHRQEQWMEWDKNNPGKQPVTVEDAAELAAINSAATFWAEFDAQHAGKELISAKDAALGRALADSVLDHPRYAPLFRDDLINRRGNELTLTYIHPVLRVRIKARIDALRVPGYQLWIGDLKGTKDASPGPDGFGKEVATYDYLMQAAFYHDAVLHCREAIESIFCLDTGSLAMVPIEFEFVASQKDMPRHEFVCGHKVSEATHGRELALGRQAAFAALKTAVECDASGWWPGYDVAAQPLEVPEWALRQMENKLLRLNGDDL
jgi:hypothetical protein